MPIYTESVEPNSICETCGDLMAATGSGFQCETCTREQLGKAVREAWVTYCLQTGDFKESHVAGWDFISEWDKEADRRIGEAVHEYIVKNRLSLIK